MSSSMGRALAYKAENAYMYTCVVKFKIDLGGLGFNAEMVAHVQ